MRDREPRIPFESEAELDECCEAFVAEIGRIGHGEEAGSLGPPHRPQRRLVRRGRKRLVPVAELERWTAENAGRVLGEIA